MILYLFSHNKERTIFGLSRDKVDDTFRMLDRARRAQINEASRGEFQYLLFLSNSNLLV